MWIFEGKEIKTVSDMPNEDVYGFIYEVTHTPTNKKYIGKKVIKYHRKLPPLKGTKKKRLVEKESNWISYYGSNDVIKNLLKEKKHSEFKREILIFAYSKIELTYLETKYQFIREVLEKDNYLNINILGKFYKGRI
jgi:hypothetical protein